jgi:hypothetical protein
MLSYIDGSLNYYVSQVFVPDVISGSDRERELAFRAMPGRGGVKGEGRTTMMREEEASCV